MPYHALLEATEANPTIDVGACVAFAPDDLFDAFSYAAEHLPDDSAIASLLSCAVALRATAEQTEIGVRSALAWIDEEIARLWTARGVYPGLGSALTRRHAISHEWRKLVNSELKDMPSEPALHAEEDRARTEKAAALAQLACSRFSVLVGPAGSGKTTLLKILCTLPEVSSGGLLLLAPTGKARVRLEEATERQGQGKTLAQFLNGLKRYDGLSGRYFRKPDAPQEKGYRTVIVDEASMLTEDQLVALLDAIEGVERLILVGDPRQLPPIGAGLRIPRQSGRGFRFDVGHRSDLIPATIPI